MPKRQSPSVNVCYRDLSSQDKQNVELWCDLETFSFVESGIVWINIKLSFLSQEFVMGFPSVPFKHLKHNINCSNPLFIHLAKLYPATIIYIGTFLMHYIFTVTVSYKVKSKGQFVFRKYIKRIKIQVRLKLGLHKTQKVLII